MDVPVLEMRVGDSFPYEYDGITYYVTATIGPETFTDQDGNEKVRLWSARLIRDHDLDGFMVFNPEDIITGVMRKPEG